MRKIEAIIPFAPVTEKVPLSVALFRYVDQLDIGIATDPEAIPDHERFKGYLEDAFEEVLRLGGTKAPSRRKAGAAKAAPGTVAKRRGARRRTGRKKAT